MKKKTARPRPVKAAAPVTIPPLVAAVARLADQMADRIPKQFTRAYAEMPALVAKTQDGDKDALWTVLRRICELDAAERAAEREPTFTVNRAAEGRLSAMTVAVSILNDKDPDLVANLMTPVMDGSFLTGVAFACFVLTNGGAR